MRVRIKKKFTLIISSIICLVLLCGMFPCSVSASGNTLNLTAKTQWNGHMYALYETAATWAEAKVLCQTVGGHLATVTSSEEQKTIVTQEITKLNKEKNAIMICENLITTKGFENCVIFVNVDSISVIIKADELKTDEIAQIQNIVSREMNAQVENIHIMTK